MHSDVLSNRETYHHGDLYRSLLDAALKLIEEDGLEGLSLRKMASRCKVSQTAPYRHFASKEHLLAVLAERGCEDLLASMQRALAAAGSGLEERVISLLAAYINFAQLHCSYFQMIFNLRLLDRQNYPSLAKAMSKPRDLLYNSLIDYGLHQDRAHLFTNHLWGYAHGMATLIINRQWDAQQLAESTIVMQLQQFLQAMPKLLTASKKHGC